MMEALIRDGCLHPSINCTINASPWARASCEKEASCNIMLERAAVREWALSGHQPQEDEEASCNMKYFPPVVYFL